MVCLVCAAVRAPVRVLSCLACVRVHLLGCLPSAAALCRVHRHRIAADFGTVLEEVLSEPLPGHDAPRGCFFVRVVVPMLAE